MFELFRGGLRQNTFPGCWIWHGQPTLRIILKTDNGIPLPIAEHIGHKRAVRYLFLPRCEHFSTGNPFALRPYNILQQQMNKSKLVLEVGDLFPTGIEGDLFTTIQCWIIGLDAPNGKICIGQSPEAADCPTADRGTSLNSRVRLQQWSSFPSVTEMGCN